MEPGIIQLGLVMVAALQTIYYYSKLPARIASHFGAGGVADGWSSTSHCSLLIGSSWPWFWPCPLQYRP